MSTHVPVSVIIPAYNRKSELEQLLAALAAQTLHPGSFEVIVVDDGSDDGTRDWLDAHKPGCGFSFSWFAQEHRGPGAARNLGMEKAAGAIFVFIDTDCIPQADWLEQLIKPFASGKVGAVGGREIINERDPLLMRSFHYLMTAPLTTGGMRGKEGKRLARFYPRTFNMAMSRKAYEATGGFRSMYHAEDIELSFRIRQAGFELLYEGRAQVYHRRRSTVSQYAKQLFNMGKARVTLARLHRGSLEPLHIMPALLVVVFALLLTLLPAWLHVAPYILLPGIAAAMLFLAILAVDSALRLHAPQAFFIVPFLFILQQGSYGIGFLLSLIRPEKVK
jgi:cellulose synthase/poly-beta-1,6-N-acetylglucosamine synthase-like glycosyltransferase